MAQLVEHILGKDEVPSSNLGSSSRKTPIERSGLLVFLGLLSDSNCCSVASQRSPVRIYRPKIDKLACQAKGVYMFTEGEYLGSAPVVFLGSGATKSLPPGGRCHEVTSDGGSQRAVSLCIRNLEIPKLSRAPSTTLWSPSLPEGGFTGGSEAKPRVLEND